MARPLGTLATVGARPANLKTVWNSRPRFLQTGLINTSFMGLPARHRGIASYGADGGEAVVWSQSP